MDPELKSEQIIPDTDNKESVNFSENTDNNNNNQSNKIEQALENKFPGEENTEKREQLSDLFKGVKNIFDQGTIIDYINNTGNKYLIKILREEPENRQKYLIDEIDIYKNNSIYTEVVTKESEVVTKESEVVTKESEVVKEKIEVFKEKIESNEFTKLFQETKDNYDKLPPELKPNQKQLNQQKKDLDQNGTLNDLKNKGLSEDQINDYVTFNYTYNHHQEELKDTEFGKSYEKLQDSLGLNERDGGTQIMNDLKDKNKVNETIKNSSTLNSFKQSIDVGDNTPSNKEYAAQREELTKLENPDEINEKFENKENQILIKKYQTLLPKQPEEDANQSKEQNDQQLLKRRKDTIIQANDLAQQSKNILQNRILGSAISGLAGYFDFSTAQKESAGEDLKIKDGFDIDQNIFSLKGTINGKEIDMNYNLLDGNLSIEDYLFQEKDQNVMRIGQNKFQDLKIQLPSIAMLRNQALDIGKKEVSGDNPKEYLENLENDLHQDLTSNFKGNQEIVKVRLERALQKNLAVQETLKNFNKIINPDGTDVFNNKDFGEDTTNKNLFKLLQTVDNSLESYSISDIEDRRNNMNILTDFINTSINDQTPDNKFKETFKKNLSTKSEQNDEENQNTKAEYLYKIVNSLCTTKNTKEVVDLDNFKKLTNQLEAAVPDTDKLSENTQKLFDPTEENPEILLAKRPEKK